MVRRRRPPRAITVLGALALTLATAGCGGDDAGDDGDGGDGGDDAGAAITTDAAVAPGDGCEWAMAGHDLARTATTTCDEGIARDSLDRLAEVWSHETDAEVTGAPVVDGDTVYFGDWDGMLHALDRATGEVRWEVQLPTSPHVYAGQVTAGPVLAEVGTERAVVVASGRDVVAVRTSDGSSIWGHTLGDPADPADPTEVQGAPVVAGDRLLVPTDVHNNDEGYRSGLVALALADGSPEWVFDPEAGAPAGGCGSIWGSPAVDLDAGLVVVGTGSCLREGSWTDASEAIVGVDLGTGELKWSHQPHEKGNDRDWDFASAPNLYEIDGRPVAGLGNKDGSYYVVDRTDGDLVWSTEAQKQGGEEGFAFGGFIGALALVDGMVVGGTAVGDCPCQHAFDAATGELVWQSSEPTGTYAPASAVADPDGGVVFQTGIDQTLRAFDAGSGDVLWEATLRSISSSAPAIAGSELFIGTGFREPGSPATGGGGVQAFRVLAPGERPPEQSSTTAPAGPAVTVLAPAAQACVGSPCEVGFTLKDPPAGASPSLTLEITPDPLRISLVASDLGDPADWLDPEGNAAVDGATTYMAFLTPRDDKPELGSILCTFGPDDGGCEADRIPVAADRWTRLSVVATVDATTPPTLTEGFDRLVTTHSFDPPLTPAK